MVSRASLAFCKNNRVLSTFVLYRRKRFNCIVSYFHEAEQSYMHDHDHEREEKTHYTTGPLHPELSDTIQNAPSEPLSSTKCRLGSLAWLPELC
jgi:hypothetical protein